VVARCARDDRENARTIVSAPYHPMTPSPYNTHHPSPITPGNAVCSMETRDER
jgi:hypothetical protein